MKKVNLAVILLLFTCGCSNQTVTSGPPTITIKEIPPIEVNLGSYDLNDLKQYITATDASGKTLSEDQIVLSGYIDTHVLSTFQIQIKATDSSNASSTSSLSVKTIDTTAPTFIAAQNPIIQYINTDLDYSVKNCGVKISDNFNYEDALIKNTRIFNTVENNKPGNYAVTYTTKDSSDNTSEFNLEVQVSDDIDLVANSLYRKALELFRGSNDYFLYGKHDTNAYHTELLNFHEIIDHTFFEEAKESFIARCTQEEGWLLIENDAYYLDWEKLSTMPIALSLDLEREKDEEENRFTYQVVLTYKSNDSEENIMQSKTKFVIGIEENSLKVLNFENPFIISENYSESETE